VRTQERKAAAERKPERYSTESECGDRETADATTRSVTHVYSDQTIRSQTIRSDE
jgi:hypothetical protein